MAAITAAAYAASASAYCSREALERRHKWEQLRAMSRPALQPKAKRKTESDKCPGCGSFEYKLASSGWVCSYCRTPESD